MGNIVTSGNSRWESAKFAPPPDVVLARIAKKMTVDASTGEVKWVPGEAPTKKSDDGLVGYLRPDGYRVTQIGKSLIPVARVAYYLHHGIWPRGVVRFKNSDVSDFSKDNLVDMLDDKIGDSAVAHTRIEQTTQAQREAKWVADRSLIEAAGALDFLANGMDQEIAKQRDIIEKYNASGMSTLMRNAVPKDRIEQEARDRAYRSPTRDYLNMQLKTLGVQPPKDVYEAARLLLALS